MIYVIILSIHKITVSPNGSVAVFPDEVSASFGDNVTFNCSAKGGPHNVFRWLKDGEILPDEEFDVLTIYNVNATMHGGRYTCLVNNTAGFGIDVGVLNVNPLVITQPVNTTAENGSIVVLVFLVESFPNPSYQWVSLNGNSGSATAFAVNSSKLVFDPVLFTDGGQYQCIATSNDQSVTSIVITLSGNLIVLYHFFGPL